MHLHTLLSNYVLQNCSYPDSVLIVALRSEGASEPYGSQYETKQRKANLQLTLLAHINMCIVVLANSSNTTYLVGCQIWPENALAELPRLKQESARLASEAPTSSCDSTELAQCNEHEKWPLA